MLEREFNIISGSISTSFRARIDNSFNIVSLGNRKTVYFILTFNLLTFMIYFNSYTGASDFVCFILKSFVFYFYF